MFDAKVRSITKTYHNKSDSRPLLFLASCDRSFLSPSPKWTLLQDCGCREKGLCSSIDRSGLSYSIFRTARASSSLVFRQLVAALKECSFRRACCSVFGFLIACMTAFFSERPFSKKNCVVNIFSIVFDYH